MSEIKLTSANYREVVENEEKPVLIDFYADWCGPCQMVSPIVAEIAEEQEGKVVVAKVNVDEQMELAQKFAVVSIPTLVVMEKGQMKNKAVGYREKEEIMNMIF